MKLDRNTLIARITLILCCLALAIGCFIHMNKSYDPLARYIYATDENREIILEYLSTDDISYMIDQQIKPKQFLDFIELDGFNIRNTTLYYAAKNTQDEDNAFIVNFVNRYRSHLSNKNIKDLLANYSYEDLISYYETELVLHEDLKLVSNPSDPLLLLGNGKTVYKYVPDSLVECEGIYVQSIMVNNLKEMCDAYKKTIGKSMTFLHGYLSYEDVMNKRVKMEELYPDIIDMVMYPSGQNEVQLGYTIVLKQADKWIELCMNANAFETYDYSTILEENKDYAKIIEWLEENAYRYGFVIRYPMEKEDETSHIYQPFVLRYVGYENAKAIQESGILIEDYDLAQIEE